MTKKQNASKTSARIKPDTIAEFLLRSVSAHPTDLVAVAMKEFGLTRPAIHAHLNQLIRSGQIQKTGARNKVVYHKTANKIERHWTEKIGSEGDENRIWESRFEPLVKKLRPNIQDVLHYSVSEMVNNAIDHSQGTDISLSYEETKETVTIHIGDDGVGLFKKISGALKLDDEREAILHLSKGKFTTDPKNHSGQGIFFTSRAVDEFAVQAGMLMYMRFRKESDWLFETEKQPQVGTLIRLVVDKRSDVKLAEVFKAFSEDEDPGFNKTHVMVELAKLQEENYVSRSQARRLILGLEKFEDVVLDFKRVRSVGQGFVDEVFRVFAEKNPSIKIKYINANADVDFMIRRGRKS